MKPLVALFALLAFLGVLAVFMTEEPPEVPADAYNVRSGFLGDTWLQPIQGSYRDDWEEYQP